MVATHFNSNESSAAAEVEIVCQAGKRLHCRIVQPVSAAWARLLIVHGYGEHAGRYATFMRFLASGGVASEAIDLRGHGKSPGRRGFVSRWEEYLEDVQAFLQREGRGDSPPIPTFILGHSHGGLIAAAAGEAGLLGQFARTGCILSSPYFATMQRVPTYKRVLGHVANRMIPWLQVPNGLRPEWITGDPAMREEYRHDPLMNHFATPGWYFAVRAAQTRTLRDACAFKIPLLCLVGENDIIAAPKSVANFYADAGSPDKSLYTYAGGVHELLRDFTRETASADVLRWMRVRVTAG